MFGVLIIALILAVLLGASDLPRVTVAQALWQALLRLFGAAAGPPEMAETILATVRLPRVLVVACSGGALAVAGVVSQGLFRNELASPSVLGTEAGGSCAAALVFYLGSMAQHWLVVPVAAATGALLTTMCLLRITDKSDSISSGAGNQDLARLLLVGLALSATAGAITSLVVSLALEDYLKASAMLHWLFGGFIGKGWEHVEMILPLFILGTAIAWTLAPKLDVLALGADVATSLGVEQRRLRRKAIVAIALLVGGSVAVAGAVPFVGLIVPHATRALIGPKHRALLMMSLVNGMTLLLIADLIARTVRAPREMEVGVLTALIGAPFFLWLLLKQRRPT